MSLSKKQMVDLPEHTVFVKHGNIRYVYLITKSFRNEKGQPDNSRISIGKMDEATGKLIPNMNYYEHFNVEKPSELPNMVRGCGSYIVCKELSDTIGLTEDLVEAFPEESEEILTGAHYMLTEGSTMYYLDDWLDDTISFTPDAMDDVAIGRVFKNITEEKKNQFFRLWMNRRSPKEYIAYDVTSISSYSNCLEDVEYGYNRDKEKLPQINYGMYFGEESRLPFYYRIYPGSINDKTHCEYMVAGTDWLDLKKAYFVFDKGIFTEENLKYLTDKGHRFMSPVPPTLKKYRELIDQSKSNIINNYSCKMSDKLIYCKAFDVNWYGFRMRVHLFYNQEKSIGNAEAFYARLQSMKNDIAKMTELPSKQSVYYDYFELTDKGGYIVAKEKMDEINKALDRCGFFAIAETLLNKTSAEVLEIYSNRDSIEKCFDDLKNELDLDRIKCSNKDICNGKMFTGFISLILLSQIRKKLSVYAKKNHTTIRKILNELDKIKLIYDSNEKKRYRLLNPLTKKQKEILAELNISENSFDNIVF